jgi:AbrB family looped-hinge helix DNA binding protein
VTTTITVSAKRQVVLPKALCERKNIRAGTSLRIREDGDGFYVTPVPAAAEAELEAIFKTLHAGRHNILLTAEDESRLDKEIKKYRAEQRRRKG